MKDGLINLDSTIGRSLGFYSSKFEECSYLFKVEDKIYISFIESKEKRKGHLNKLFNNIWEAGYKVAVPTPMPLMEQILINKNFKKTQEGEYEVWVKLKK